MADLWEQIRRSATYTEPTVTKGTRKKSTKELEEERNVADLKVKQIQTERKNLLNDYGVKTDEIGNVKRTTEYNSNPLITGSKYKKQELVDSENIKKEQEFKTSEKGEEYNALTKPLVENWNKRAEINEEINERYAEWEAKNISDWAKPIKGFALGWWNKQTLFTANEDMLRDEDGNFGDIITGKQVKSQGEILTQKQEENETGISRFIYDYSKLMGELSDIYSKGGNSINYFTDIFKDTYQNDLKNGYSEQASLKNALGQTFVSYAKDKLFGTIAGNAFKIEDKSVEGLISNALSKKIKSKTLNDIITRTSGGFIDEFTDSFVEQAWENYAHDGTEHIFDGMNTKEFWANALYEGILGAVSQGSGESFKQSFTPTNQKVYEQTVYDIERDTGNKLSIANEDLISNIIGVWNETNLKYTSEDVYNEFKNEKEKYNNRLLESANEARSQLNLDEEHSKLWNKEINQIANASYETNQPVKFDLNQDVLVKQEGNTLVFNPKLTDMPVSNLVLREIAKNTLDDSTRTLILDKLKAEGVYDTFREELLATGEFNEENVDNEIIASELDAIFSNDEEMAKLSENKKVFSGIKDTIDRISNALSKDPATKDSIYMKQLSNRIKENFGDINKKIEIKEEQHVSEEKPLEVDKNDVGEENKEEQFKIIQKTNPAPNENNTWIRSKEDINTFKEAYDTAKSEAEDGGWENYASYPDITKDIVNEALKTGKITVYSSYQIENGVFVTPSYRQALDYAGNDKSKVNSKEVNIDDVAWINLDEGQYAKVEQKQPKEKVEIKDKQDYEKKYRSTEKLPENVSEGTYIEPSTPIKEDKKAKKAINKLTGNTLTKGQLSKDYTSIVDKLHPIQLLADASGNKQLYAKYNNRGMSNGMGQYQVGTAQTDINGNKIGKSINEIWKPIEDAKLTEQFDDYLAHRLNEERYEKVPVWDETVTPEISREIINEYESKYPQFKELAEDVYKFNDNQLQKMIDAGLSKENARDWLYSQYVTISREIAPKTSPLVQNATGVKVNSPIRKAKGGNQEIRPMKESMARQTILTERAIADNIAGQELLNVLGGTVGDSKNLLTQTLEGENNALVQNADGTYNYTVYKNGVPVTMQVTKEIADAIKPTKISDWENLGAFKALRKASSIQRGLLTDKNPLFIFTNFFKDLGDAPLNSKYGAQLYAKYPSAVYKMLTNSNEWQQYVAKGGKSNTYFQSATGEFTKSKNKFINAIQSANELIEQAPRFTEYLLTLEHGGTLDEALYNSAEVTTNFARGGDITKALNRNGATFLNASVQGFDKQIRNFTGQNGVKGYVNLLAKVAILGVAPAMLNHLLLQDDDDYEELPDYVKDNYFLFKTGDDKFVRIPKGRVMSIFGTASRHVYETSKGNETLLQGLKDTGTQFVNNVAPNNPIENNVLAPIIAVANNKSWSGSAIVSQTLQKQPDDLQYDEKTSSIAKFLGKTFNYSPKKIDYLLDQYTGAIGDFVLPATTPQAESETKNPLVSAFKSKFTVDSTISSKYVSDFYDKKNELEKETKRYSSIEESEDAYINSLQYKYLDDVGTEIAKLYTEKRAIQNSDLDDKTKYQQARAIQRQIDDLAKFAMQDYTEGYYTDSYAEIGDKEYYVNYKNGKASWNKVTEDTKKKQEEYAEKYDIPPEGYYEMKPLTQSYSAGSIENYNKYYQEIKDIQSKTSNDKEETIKYINNLDLSIPQKAMMIKSYGYKFDDYNDEIFNYVNSLNIIPEQKQEILINLGFDYNKYTKQFSWK